MRRKEWASEWMWEWVHEWEGESVSVRVMGEWVSGWASEWISEWVSGCASLNTSYKLSALRVDVGTLIVQRGRMSRWVRQGTTLAHVPSLYLLLELYQLLHWVPVAQSIPIHTDLLSEVTRRHWDRPREELRTSFAVEIYSTLSQCTTSVTSLD